MATTATMSWLPQIAQRYAQHEEILTLSYPSNPIPKPHSQRLNMRANTPKTRARLALVGADYGAGIHRYALGGSNTPNHTPLTSALRLTVLKSHVSMADPRTNPIPNPNQGRKSTRGVLRLAGGAVRAVARPPRCRAW